jgi:hypothetical protein
MRVEGFEKIKKGERQLFLFFFSLMKRSKNQPTAQNLWLKYLITAKIYQFRPIPDRFFTPIRYFLTPIL